MKRGTTGQASIHVDAPPERVYDLVTDVTRMGEWSPETVSCTWLDGAGGPALGARFKGVNRRGVFRWSTKPRVVALEPGREFAFTTEFAGLELVRWTYRFDPDGDGTRVTESFEMVRDEPIVVDLAMRWLMRIKDRKADLESAMHTTLTRIKAAAERTTAEGSTADG